MNDWFQCFSHQLTNAYAECNHVTVSGDFNIDLLKSDADSNTWLELMENYQFSQLINEPTKVTNKSTTLIDHILTTTSDKVRCTKDPKIGISDHSPTVVVYKDNFGRKGTHITIKYRSEKNFDKDNYLLDLANCEWVVLDNVVNVNKALEHWYQMFLDIVDKHAPLKEKRVNIANQPEWITDGILKKMAECDHYKDIGDENNYRQTRNKVTNMIQLSKTEYYATLVETNQGNSKTLWSYSRELVPK